METFETMLTGGHPNSLGRTLDVVDVVLGDQTRLQDLLACYASPDEVVRLRTSSALKRITALQPAWVVPYLDRLLTDVAQIDQASTHWTLAILFQQLKQAMSDSQREQALAILKRNLAEHNDWIVLNNTMQTLAEWAEEDDELVDWLVPQLLRLQEDPRKSVAKRARKLLTAIDEAKP